MRDILERLDCWMGEGETLALATLVAVHGSAPRVPGARLAVTRSGKMAGSVSGGCVEADVILHAQDVLETNTPRLVHYGISDELAFTVGLACGGVIDVYIEPIESLR